MAQMQAPTQIGINSLSDYLEVMSKAVFQSGMPWKMVASKWPQIREAMRNFDVDSLATLSTDDLEELAHDTRVKRLFHPAIDAVADIYPPQRSKKGTITGDTGRQGAVKDVYTP